MTRIWTRARCATSEHERKRVVFVTLWCWVTCTSWLKFWVPSCHPCTCASLFEFTSLTVYFDLSFTNFSLFFPLMHFEQHTELDNMISIESLCSSANKGSDDAYDVSTSLTKLGFTWSSCQRRRFVEDQDTILEITGKIQELKNDIKCMNDSRDFQDAESVRSGNSLVTSRPVSAPPHPILGRMLSRSTGVPNRREGPPSIWDTHGISRKFLQIQLRLLQHLIFKNWIHGIPEEKKTVHSSTVENRVRNKHQPRTRDASPDRQPKVPSPPVREDPQTIMEQTNNDCRFQIIILTNSPRQQRLLVGRLDSRLEYVLVHNFLRKRCNG